MVSSKVEIPCTDVFLSVCLGIGRASACGFRVFVPPFIVSVAQALGLLPDGLAPEWMASEAAVIGFGVVSVVEIGAYYIPWVDNALDVIATPTAVIAGMLVSGAMMDELDPAVRWSLSIVAGGGAAAMTQTATVLARGASTAGTGGLANFVVASTELLGSIVVTAVTLVFAPLALLLVLGIVVWTFWRMRRE
jgi:hypothetical protein